MHTPHPWRGLRQWKRHSAILLVAGLIYIVLGLSYMLIPLTKDSQKGLHLALHWFPVWFWGLLFVVSGLLTVVSSRWPPVSETWGYIVLTGLSCGWAAVYASGVLFFHTPHTNIRAAVTFGLLGYLWWGISGTLNPDDGNVLLTKLAVLQRELDALHKINEELLEMTRGQTRQER